MLEWRPADEQDKAFLKRLAKLCYSDLVERQFGAWDDKDQERLFEAKWKSHDYQIIELNGDPIGTVWITRESDHLWLREIQISPDRQNRGVGTRIMSDLLRQSNESGLPLRLRVLTQNPARRLYERMGFKIIGKYEDTHFWMERRG